MAQGTNLFTSHEARILAVNAGSEEQPVYFTGGEPTATSYSLKATVNNGDAKYVAYYSNGRLIASSKPTYDMRMPAHYYHNLYEDNPIEGTTVYVHYYNTDTTSTNTFANLRVKSGSTFKTFVFGGDGNCSWEGHILANGGYLKSTANGNTITIGSQNSGWCHIYNTASIPFIFNNTICTTAGDLGHTSYPFGNLILKSGGRVSGNGGSLQIGNSNNASWVQTQDICSQNGTGDTYWSLRVAGVAHFKTAYGAVWNDYAEMRNVPKAQIDIHRIYDDKGEIERDYPYAGHCVYEIGDGTMELTSARLIKGCKIISDTFGFCIGETEDCCTPIAVTGRVLAYPYENIEEYKNHIGDYVCSGPNGTISIMTSEEITQHPECIVGTISEIPTYTTWRCGNKDTKPINVNGRIWIYVR